MAVVVGTLRPYFPAAHEPAYNDTTYWVDEDGTIFQLQIEFDPQILIWAVNKAGRDLENGYSIKIGDPPIEFKLSAI